MAAPKQKEYRLEELEKHYEQIEYLYDLTEHFIATVEAPDVGDAHTQMALVEPLINEVTDATDVLTEEFIAVAKQARKHSGAKASKSRIESALRRVYTAMNDYRERSERVYGKTSARIRTLTDKIVDAIQEHVEAIIAIFCEFIQLSLQSVMNKVELDMLYQRQQKLALQMHTMNQPHQ